MAGILNYNHENDSVMNLAQCAKSIQVSLSYDSGKQYCAVTFEKNVCISFCNCRLFL